MSVFTGYVQAVTDGGVVLIVTDDGLRVDCDLHNQHSVETLMGWVRERRRITVTGVPIQLDAYLANGRVTDGDGS